MKIIAAFFLIISICLYAGSNCFAQDETVTSDRLTIDDIDQALLSGAITSNCSLHGFPDQDAASLNPDTVIIKGIYQRDGEATIHFMGRFEKIIRADEAPVICEAHLQRLDSGEWLDPNNGYILEK